MRSTDVSKRQGRFESPSSIALWLLIVVASVALLVVGRALWLQLRASPRVSAQQLPQVAGGQSLSQAYGLLSNWAKEWQPDAEPLNAVTSYRRGQESAEGWTFQVYSPSQNRISLVRVRGKDVMVLRETPARQAQTAPPETVWQVDSSKALAYWWDQGGETVWPRRSSEALHVRFGLNGAEAPTWQISVSQTGSTSLAFWEITADAKTMLQQSQQ